jgi:hypothetical protein
MARPSTLVVGAGHWKRCQKAVEGETSGPGESHLPAPVLRAILRALLASLLCESFAPDSSAKTEERSGAGGIVGRIIAQISAMR